MYGDLSINYLKKHNNMRLVKLVPVYRVVEVISFKPLKKRVLKLMRRPKKARLYNIIIKIW